MAAAAAYSTTFTGDVGYRGVVKLAKNGNGATVSTSDENMVILLATSGSINLAHDPIFSSGVWGAGYMNASEQVAYADNYLKIDGSFGCEMTAGDGFMAIKNFAFTNRGAKHGTGLLILPNGEHGFQGAVWCTSLSFSMSQDAVLTADLNWSSYIDGTNNKIVVGTNSNSAYGASGAADEGREGKGLPFAYNALFPYWASSVWANVPENASTNENSGDEIKDVTDWSCSYSSSLEFLKCCGAGTAYKDSYGAPLAPDYVILGPMSAECSFTVFKLADEFAPESYHAQRSLAFYVHSPSEVTGTNGAKVPNSIGAKIALPKIVRNSGSTSIQTGASFVTAEFSFTAIGDGKKPPMGIEYSQLHGIGKAPAVEPSENQ